MKFKRINESPIEAEQYLANQRPVSVCVDIEGQAYVVDIRNQQIKVWPGDWIVLEPDGVHYRAIADNIFRRLYELA